VETKKISRNAICPCGSGNKYKRCCLLAVLQHSDAIDLAWRKLRQTEGELIDQYLLPYAAKNFSKTLGKIAWDDFVFGKEWPEKLYENLQENLFMPWFLFDWIPKIEETSHHAELHNKPIALNYLQQFYHRCSEDQVRFIETICQTHYSFYVVLDVIPRQSIKLKDILLQTEQTVKEYQGTDYLHKGDIMFTRILSLDGTSISIGTAPRIIPSHCHIELLDFRKTLETEHRIPLTPALLRKEGDSIRLYFFDLMNALFNKPLPVLHNTDGDLFEICTVHFKLSIHPQEALHQLLPLALSDNPEEFLEEAKKNKQGQFTQIKLPWLKSGNQQHAEWDNTLMGHMIIGTDKITVEVNSKIRAEAISKLINDHLGDAVSYQKTVVGSIAKKLSSMGSSKQKESEKINIQNAPELQEFLKEYTN